MQIFGEVERLVNSLLWQGGGSLSLFRSISRSFLAKQGPEKEGKNNRSEMLSKREKITSDQKINHCFPNVQWWFLKSLYGLAIVTLKHSTLWTYFPSIFLIFLQKFCLKLSSYIDKKSFIWHWSMIFWPEKHPWA